MIDIINLISLKLNGMSRNKKRKKEKYFHAKTQRHKVFFGSQEISKTIVIVGINYTSKTLSDFAPLRETKAIHGKF